MKWVRISFNTDSALFSEMSLGKREKKNLQAGHDRDYVHSSQMIQSDSVIDLKKFYKKL
jgi:hypothetical protein